MKSSISKFRRILALCMAATLGLLAAAACQEQGQKSESKPPEIKRDFSPLRQVLLKAIDDKAFPGCTVAAGDADRVLYLEALGQLDSTGTGPVSPGTLYDLASLTKVVGTTSVVIKLVESGKLAVSDPLEKHLPGWNMAAGMEGPQVEWRKRVTVEHLLTHSSGLPAWAPLYQRTGGGYAPLVETAGKVKLIREPGAREEYSDVGVILLGRIAEQAGGAPLRELEEGLIFGPLGMTSTTRRPLELVKALAAGGLGERTIAPTENKPDGKPWLGIVHDENARGAEGLTGHAGLFSTAGDMGLLCMELLQARDGRGRVFGSGLMQEFTRARGLVKGSSRALGWDTWSRNCSAGKLMSPNSFGHTGFTGTSVWIDPERKFWLVLLTNRVNPTRQNSKIIQTRKAAGEAAVLAFEGLQAAQ